MSSSQGVVIAGPQRFPCLLGKTGLSHAKREGDGASPIGTFRLRSAYWRQDRIARPSSRLPFSPLGKDLGWCDAPGHGQYNRLVKTPFAASHENLWRTDSAYDVLVVIDYNLEPRHQYRGSAIFLHLIRDGATHTEGCVALTLKDMRKLLALCGPATRIMIGPHLS